MGTIIVKALQGLAKLLDKYVPGAGARHIVIAVLVIIGNVSLFLTGHIQADQAGSNIATAFGILFAAAHQNKPSE